MLFRSQSFNPSAPLDASILSDYNLILGRFGYPLDVNEILFTSNDNIVNWTPTKLWLQMCMELKEVLKNGLPFSFKSGISSIPSNNDADFINTYKDPYLLTDPILKDVKRFSFSKKQIKIPPLFGENVVINDENIDRIILDANKIFNNSSGIFSGKVMEIEEDSGSIIAKLSNIICQEIKFSNNLKKDLLDTYGFSTNQENFSNIWDYAIGQIGKDITDIDPNPIGNKNSLVSLSQTAEDNVEILTFEDKFLNDDIVSDNSFLRRNAIITPGFHYYIEGSMVYENNDFNTTKLNTLRGRLDNSIKFFDMIVNDMSFQQYPLAYKKLSEKVINFKLTNSQSYTSKYDKDIFFSPINLIRKIENEVLSDSYLLKRSGDYQEIKNSYISAKTTKNNIDFSACLISLSMEDHLLKSYLFLYCVLTTNLYGIKDSLLQSTVGNKTLNYTFQELVADKIHGRLRENISDVGQQTQLIGFNNTTHQINELIDNFKGNGNFPILDKISLLMNNILLNTKFKKKSERVVTKIGNSNIFDTMNNEDAELDSDNYITQYSGIQRTIFIAAVFELCCQIVHAANPERIAGLATVSDKYGLNNYGKDFIVVESQYENIIGKYNLKGNLITLTGDEDSSGFDWYNSILGVFAYKYDQTILNAENKLSNYANLYIKYINRFRMYLLGLKKNLDVFNQYLSDSNNVFFRLAKLFSNNTSSYNRLFFSKEQLRLSQSKLLDLQERAKSIEDSNAGNWKSPLTDTFYFASLDNPVAVNSYLPIEDISLISWRYLVRGWLQNLNDYAENESFNKKVISVGIPPNFLRNLVSNVTNQNSNFSSNSIIRINLFRIDNLFSNLIHRPISFLFDMERFPTKVLKNYYGKNYIASSQITEIVSNTLSPRLFYKQVPFYQIDPYNPKNGLKLFENGTTNPQYTQGLNQKYSMLTEEEKDQITYNHYSSFIAEEYLKFMSDTDFSENVYSNFYMTSGAGTNTFSNKKSIINSTFLNTDANKILESCLKIRKFDRVFHILFDQDDFYVDLVNTPASTIQAALQAGRIDPVVDNNGNTIYKRRKLQSQGNISYDQYFVTVESYG